jgi:hypothetical protein
MRSLRQALAPPYPVARTFHDSCAATLSEANVMTHAPRSRTRPACLAVAAMAAALAIGGCALRSPSIADIRVHPGRYDDRVVIVEGVVTSAWSIPFVPVHVYRIDDRTGDLTVVSDGTRLPPQGARVVVRGRIAEVGRFGRQSIGLHLRERSVHVVGRG